MRYRIEYANGKCCRFVNSSKDLIDRLKLVKMSAIFEKFMKAVLLIPSWKNIKSISLIRCCNT